jgi:ABC-type sugar transport system substrate-binding protein
VSREFSEELGRSLIVETSQTGAIVVGDEGVEVGIAFGMAEKAAVVGGTVLRHPDKMLAEAAVEALDHAVGLRPEGLGEAVGDGARGADPVEEVVARGSILGFCLLVDGEAVGELGAVVGRDGVDLEREAVEEAVEKSGGGGGPAIGEDFEIDKAGGAVDRDPSLRWGRL